MSFVVHRAERADVLADVLAELLAEPLEDPFASEVVAVHSRGIERWLSNRLAARLGTSPGAADGVCANLDFPFPGRLVNEALAAATGIDAATDPWRPERLVWPLLDVVDATITEPWLRVLAGHIGADASSPDRDRRFSAVRHLADLFDRYAVHRPAMLLAWVAGADEDGEGAPLPSDLAWQAELWRRVRTVLAVASPPERLAVGCQALIEDPGQADLPSRLSLFGLTRVPGSYVDVLAALAVHREVHLLTLHPSPAAWSTAAVAHPLLRSWGRDSLEMQQVLAGRLATQPGVVEAHHALPAAAPVTVLEYLQHGIRTDTPPTASTAAPPAPGDRSVQIHACHGRARQAEVVRDAILHLLEADPSLEPRDVVVMCPDIDEMAPLLRAAFERGHDPAEVDDPARPAIPYRLADRSIRQTNPVLGAMAELLWLVDSRATASEVLAFAALPPVRSRFRLDDDDLERLADWVQATGIRWGLDRDHRSAYDLATVEAGTWDAGLARLLLGITMSEDDQRVVEGVLPLDDVDSGDIDLAGRLAELVGRLREARTLLAGPLPVAGWVAAIDRAADLFLHTRQADSWQRAQLDRLLVDVLDERGTGAGPSMRLAEVRDLLANRLRGQPSRAAFRTGDLTMCTLVPMRSVPHRVVCLVGLDDGAFPRGGAPDGDDVLVRARHLGDHERRAEDRQLLLDAVLAATDGLVITYTGHDARTNEVLPPAVPVNELLDVLDAVIAAPDHRAGRDLVLHHHPLHPADPRCFTPGALGAAGAWSYDPDQLAGAVAAVGPRHEVGPFLTGPVPAPRHPGDMVLLDDLVSFVQHPVRAFLRQRLGLSLRTYDDRPVDALTVEMDALAAWGIGDRLLTALLAGGDLDAVCAAEVARGLLPPGALGDGVLATARQKAEAIVAASHTAAAGPRGSLEVDVALPDGRRLVGTVADVVGDVLRPTTFSRISPKSRLAAWVRYLAAVAAHPERELRSAAVGWGRGAPSTARLEPLASQPADRRTRAVARLAILVDLHDRGLCEPLPLYTATSHRYATVAQTGRGVPADAAAKFWTTGFDDWDKEDKEPEHVLVLGGVVSFADVLADAPRADEVGPGWAMDETTRFGRYARRLWDPVFAATDPQELR